MRRSPGFLSSAVTTSALILQASEMMAVITSAHARRWLSSRARDTLAEQRRARDVSAALDDFAEATRW